MRGSSVDRVNRTGFAAWPGIAGILSTTFVLGACVTLLPTPEPVTLYTFVTEAGPPAHFDVARAPIALDRVELDRTGETDRIATRRGARVANIAGARWVAPAEVLFRESLVAAFDEVTVTVVTPGGGSPVAGLNVRVPSFEVEYLSDDGPPSVVVSATATLTPSRGGAPQVHRLRVVRPAAENRVTAIVDAYSRAVEEVTSEIARWAAARLAAEPAQRS